jgi:hypothetical protein
MTDKMKRLFAAVAALAALALGGAAIAGATSGGSSSGSTATEQEQGEGNDTAEEPGDTDQGESESSDGAEAQGDQTDSSEIVSGSDAAKARAATEQATGGQAGEVTTETPDGVDANEQPAPAGTAYEVELTKGGKEMKALLDSSFKVLDVRADEGG